MVACDQIRACICNDSVSVTAKLVSILSWFSRECSRAAVLCHGTSSVLWRAPHAGCDVNMYGRDCLQVCYCEKIEYCDHVKGCLGEWRHARNVAFAPFLDFAHGFHFMRLFISLLLIWLCFHLVLCQFAVVHFCVDVCVLRTRLYICLCRLRNYE